MILISVFLKQTKKSFRPFEEVIAPCSKGNRDMKPFVLGPDGLTPHDRPNSNGRLSDSEIGKYIKHKYSLLDLLITLVKFAFRVQEVPFILPDWIGMNMCINPVSPNGNGNAMGINTPCTVAYGPMIHADPNAPSTINHFLKKVVAVKNECNIPEVALTADMALFEKFLPIINDNINYAGIALMVGDMHLDMSFFSMFGKMFPDSGYDFVLNTVDLVAEGSMAQVINGKHVNRTTRSHETMGEALEAWRFMNWLRRKHPTLEAQLEITRKLAGIIVDDIDTDHPCPDDYINKIPNLRKVIFEDNYNPDVLKIMDDYMKWVAQESATDPTFGFWSLLIDLINLVIKSHGRSIKSATSAEFMWLLYVETVAAMMPYFHYYNQTHYRRYLSWFLSSLRFFKEKRPYLYRQFMEGKYAVRRNTHNNFSDCPMDQTLEHGPNREAKVSGGINQGRTQRMGEAERWAATLPVISQIAGNFSSDIAGVTHHARSSKHLDAPQIVRHENFVKAILDIFENEIHTDPFSGHTELVNICSGEVAPIEVLRSYQECERIGRAAEEKLVRERWVMKTNTENYIPIYATIPNIKYHTWSKYNLPKVRRIDITSGPVENNAIAKLPPKDQFEKSITVASKLLLSPRPFEILTKELLLSFPLCCYPASIATYDGLFYQTEKAGLRNLLIDYAGDNADVNSTPEELSEMWTARSGVFIVDAMGVISSQALGARGPHSPNTFGEFVCVVLKRMVMAAKICSCAILHIVADAYKPGSTKCIEHRARQGRMSQHRINIARRGKTQQKLPQSLNSMKSYLACDENKIDLIEFIFEGICKEGNFDILNRLHGNPQGLVVYFAHGQRCHRISRDELSPRTFRVEDIRALTCDHNEADGRLILHSLYAATQLRSTGASTPPRIIIQSEDTDTLVIALCHSNAIATALGTTVDDAIGTFCMHLGKADPHLVDIFAIAFILGPVLCAALPGFHAVSGCDTTSYFKGVGKKTPWKFFLENNLTFTNALTALGSTRIPLSPAVIEDLEAFICRCYQSRSTASAQVSRTANGLRVKVFDRPNTKLTTDQEFPPTRDCVQCHIARAHFQTMQWRFSNQQFMNLPDVAHFGFKRVDPLNPASDLSIIWFSGPMLPQALHTPVSCGCKTGCGTKACSCRKLNLLCNSGCKCSENCQNCAATNPEPETEELDEEEQEVEDENDDENPDNMDSDGDDDVDE